MNQPTKKSYRKRHLFPRTVEDVLKNATKPLMDKQGKLYSALLSHWEQIVGPERAAVTRPQRLQFPTGDMQGAILHLSVRPSAAPELAYVTEQMLEQCARYFGYRAIGRVVIHATHGMFEMKEEPTKAAQPAASAAPLPASIPTDMRDILQRMSAHFASAIVKKK